jgi:hypothetical protein
MGTIARIAANTPATRNRAVDFYRAAALTIVVLGHWLASAIYVGPDGVLHFTNILELASWTHGLTWFVQVIPVFFIVGGYANYRSYGSAMRRRESTSAWITARFRRLMTPIVPFLVTWTAISVVAGLLGVNHDLIRAGSFAVVTPLWFLAVYLIVIVVVPASTRFWERFGWWTVPGGLVAAFGIDGLRFLTGVDAIGWLNFGVVWITAHQLGYGWATERTRPGSVRLVVVSVAALTVLVGLTHFGPYPVSMVGVPGATENNTLPPTAVLLVLSLLQYGLIRLLEPAARRWMQRRRPWTAVVGFHTVMMTVYVWHLPTMAIVVLAGYGVGTGFGVEPLTPAWWLTRPIWVLLLTVLLAGVVGVFGRFEPRVRATPAPPVPAVAFGVIASIVAISVGVVEGFVPEEGLARWWVIVLLAAGVIALGAYPSGRSRTRNGGPSADGPPTR